MLTRRDFLATSSLAFVSLGLGLPLVAADSNGKPHFTPRAKRVIFLNMRGAPSHVDLFDPKPALQKAQGKTGRNGRPLLAPPYTFKTQGKSGLAFSELLPELGKQADGICLLSGMFTDQPNHPQAQTKLHTGNFQFARPSLGAWIVYGLGTENPQLPGFITLSPASGTSPHYGSAFLPSRFQGTAIGRAQRGGGRFANSQPQLADIKNPDLGTKLQKQQLEFIQELNQAELQRQGENPEIQGVIDSYSMAYAMQGSLPKLMDLSQESKATQALYGLDQQDSAPFGRECLLARRLVEAGVRFVEISHDGWDHHFNLKNQLASSCRQIDRPIAGLLADLKQRGLLNDTLVVFSGEFGRTPDSANGNGRDHNFKGFTSWMAGGGVKCGFRHGATDDLGYEAVEGRMDTHDFHASILHLLGLDHTRLTYNYAGRDFRLTDVYGKVAKEILA
ncbi:MAG: hypothetical protein RL095_1227 [Verrucomicrobiota bacterium]|jgi:hypothetical protein